MHRFLRYLMHSYKIIMQTAQRVSNKCIALVLCYIRVHSMQEICRFACAQKLTAYYHTEPIKCQLSQTDPRDALSWASCCIKTCKLAIVERRPRQVFNSTQLQFISRQTMNNIIAWANKLNNRTAKISDICLTGRQGRHSALTDVKKIVRIQENRTEKLIETRDSEPTIKLI